MSSIGFKALDVGDVTRGGKDPYGCVLAVAIGACCATGAGTLGGDAIKNPTPRARLVLGAAMGGAVAALVAAGLSRNNSKLCLGALLLGASCGSFGASNLRPVSSSSSSRLLSSSTAASAAADAASAAQRSVATAAATASTPVKSPVRAMPTDATLAAPPAAPAGSATPLSSTKSSDSSIASN